MKALDVWALIAPILANNLPLETSDAAREAYIETYIALKEKDEREKK